ncbi:MAG: 1-(5-phosphoribosyl)-5-[(5-phosphoribosylamino) methylideneamino] imidazole-4-carboxamide isomerase [Porticoccaceae bacterium]|nr:MAG: 1-(5-phosphoribosyl)-5-[(5-phosphoribosylamino) methylideneamino] imidazole-4-carboxamide isomerase [Porticoccaceae bacterium]
MVPKRLRLLRKSGELEIEFPDRPPCRLSAEFLRVHSPSAEVRGHGAGEAVLVHGKRGVRIRDIERCGRYGVRLLFDDGHGSGIYSWDYLAELCANRERLWDAYLARLAAAGRSRDPEVQVVKILDPRQGRSD